MKRLARPPENKAVTSIPPIGRLHPVRVQVEIQIVRVQVEDVRIAVTVSYVQWAFHVTTP